MRREKEGRHPKDKPAKKGEPQPLLEPHGAGEMFPQKQLYMEIHFDHPW